MSTISMATDMVAFDTRTIANCQVCGLSRRDENRRCTSAHGDFAVTVARRNWTTPVQEWINFHLACQSRYASNWMWKRTMAGGDTEVVPYSLPYGFLGPIDLIDQDFRGVEYRITAERAGLGVRFVVIDQTGVTATYELAAKPVWA